MFDTLKLLNNRTLKPDELCPCGSGHLYRDCCSGKMDEKRNQIKPPTVQAMELLRASLPKCCMFPDKTSCKGKIKEAHALQNKKVLSLLAGDTHHVFVLATKAQAKVVPLLDGSCATIHEIKKTGVNIATTETCFCEYHDSVVFAPIEKDSPDYNGSLQMQFLYAYKTFIFEYYKHIPAQLSFQKIFKRYPATMSTKRFVLEYRMQQLRSSEYEPIKSYFDEHLLTSDYSGLCTCAVMIPYQVKFASYSYIAIDFDLNGKKIHNTIKGVKHRLSVTVIPEEKESWILLSCLQSEETIYARLFSQLRSFSVEKIILFFAYLLPLYSENIVLSPSLWESWDKTKQKAYTYYANLTGKEFTIEQMRIKFMLRNKAKKKDDTAYNNPPGINLFG